MIDLISGQRETFVSSDRIALAINRLLGAQMLVGHNIASFDLKVIERLAGVQFDHRRVLDTLQLSRQLVDMKSHKLETWGEVLGKPKLSTPFSWYHWDDRMIPYCERDVELNLEVFDALLAIADQKAHNFTGKKLLLEYQQAYLAASGNQMLKG